MLLFSAGGPLPTLPFVQPTKLELARRQLARVQVAWLDPVDWSDLSIYGLHALENAVVAAAEHLDITWQRTHPNKVSVARRLHAEHGLPDVADLLVDLNSLRKSEAYGELPPAEQRDPEDIAITVEEFLDAVSALVEGDRPA